MGDFLIFTEAFVFIFLITVSMFIYSVKFEHIEEKSLKVLYGALLTTIVTNAVCYYINYSSFFLNILYFELALFTFVIWWVYCKNKSVLSILRYLPLVFILIEEIIPCGLPLTCVVIVFGLISITLFGQYKTIRRDNLTKLMNRYGLDEEINEQLAEYKKDKNDLFYVLVCDMDNFKHINDTWGHLEGDRALKLIADTLTKISLKYDSPAFRIGGDEFVIIVDTSSDKLPLLIKDELKIKLSEINFRDDFDIRMSIGIAKYDGNSNISELLNKADMELYEAKKAKEN